MKAKVSDRFSLGIVEMWLGINGVLYQLRVSSVKDVSIDDCHNSLAFIKTGCCWVTHAREALFCNFGCFTQPNSRHSQASACIG